jgi:hypothetical protein
MTDRPGLSRRRLLAASAAVPALVPLLPAVARATTPSAGRAGGGALADAVFAAFRTHRVVGLGEVHGLQEHHDALAAVLTDPRLPEVVGAVLVEFGNALHQDTVDRFTAGAPVDSPELRRVWRDTTQSPLATWDAPVYEQVYRTVRAVNRRLPAARRIRVLAGDPPLDWSRITTRDQLNPYLLRRQAHLAEVLEREVLARGRRALVCYGAGHLFHGGSGIEGMYVIATLAPLAGDPGGLMARLSRYPRGAVVPAAGGWLGSFDAGLAFPVGAFGAPGQPPANANCGVPLRALIDAGLYLGQAGDLTVSRENPAIYLDPEYWAELRRRDDLQGGLVPLDSYRQEQPVRYAPLSLPSSMECPS